MTNNYYQKHKEKIQKEACKIYQNLSEVEKHKKQKKVKKKYKKNTKKKKKEKKASISL